MNELSEFCGDCNKDFNDIDNVISILETGSCLNCDHIFGELLNAQAEEQTVEQGGVLWQTQS